MAMTWPNAPLQKSRPRKSLRVRGRAARFGLALVAIFMTEAGWMPAPVCAGPLLESRLPAKDGSELVESGPHWSRVVPIGGRGAAPRAADRAANGDLALADETGVTWWRDEVRERAQIEDARDVAFDAAGRLWVGASSGLYVWSRTGRPERRALRGGEAANRIRRLDVQGQSVLVASEQGAFWSTTGRTFQSLEGAAAKDDYALGAFYRDPSVAEDGLGSVPRVDVWLFGRRGLVLIRGMQSGSGLRILGVERSVLPRPTRDESAVDLSISGDGRTLWVAYPDALAERIQGSETWRWLRPVMPPGAAIRRFAIGKASLFLATDHGLLEAATGEAAFRRVANSAGTSSCVDVREAKSVAIALCREGVFQYGAPSAAADRGSASRSVRAFAPEERSRSAASSSSGRELVLRADPPLPEIRRRALKRNGLSVSRAEAMRRGLARRAYWPEVALRFGADIDRDRARDADEAFVSGEKRFLLDRSRDEGLRLEAGIEFEWDLGAVAFPDDSVDLSRELRQVVSLRDDIADEINQLYFERQKIRARLLPIGSHDEEANSLYWRAREIDAGLDAWTGGWIAEWRRSRETRESAKQEDHPVQNRGKR